MMRNTLPKAGTAMTHHPSSLAINVTDKSPVHYGETKNASDSNLHAGTIRQRKRIPAPKKRDSALTGVASSLMIVGLIFGFASDTWLADFYLLPATYSGYLINGIFLLNPEHVLIESSGHQISVMLSVICCLVFWSAVFGAAFHWLECRVAQHMNARS